MRIEQFFEEAKTNFHVPDIRNEDSKILFILESPHKEELKYGVPLAGLSGLSMAKELFQVDHIEPMGKYLSSAKSVYGIVNVCPFPLQQTAYPNAFVLKFAKELEVAESIRKSTAKSFRDKNKTLFHALVINNFEQRLLNGISDETIIVPCGKFAEKFVKQISLNTDLRILEGVPHPSYNSWTRARYRDVIERVREEGKNKIG